MFGGLFKFLAKPPVDTYPLLAAITVAVTLAGVTSYNKMRNDPELGVNKANPHRFLTNNVQFREQTGANRGVIDRTLKPQNFCTSPTSLLSRRRPGHPELIHSLLLLLLFLNCRLELSRDCVSTSSTPVLLPPFARSSFTTKCLYIHSKRTTYLPNPYICPLHLLARAYQST